jgi:AraC-like DNA-binding protein
MVVERRRASEPGIWIVTSEAIPWGDGEQLRSAARECGFQVNALARFFGMSRRQLGRHFKAKLCVSPQQWLKEERLQAAQRRLASASSVKEVAYELGFRQVSQFCRDYRKRFGQPPSSELKGNAREQRDACSADYASGICRGRAPTRAPEGSSCQYSVGDNRA